MKSQILVAALFLVAACRDMEPQRPVGSHPDAPPTTSSPPDAATAAVGGTIKALLASPPAASEVIEVKGVVVVGVVKSSSRVTLFVQDPGGGPSSGIQVYCPKNGCTQYMDLGTVARGEILDVSAKYTVFQGEAELQFATVTRTGMTATPTFVEVDPAELAAATDTSSSAFQKWVGVAVKLKGGAVVTDVTADAFKTTCPNSKPGDYYTGFLARAGTKDVNIGLSLYNVVGWCLANPCELACTQPVTEGMALTQVRGIVRALGGKASVDPYLPEDLVADASQPTPDAGAVPPPDGKLAGTPDAKAAGTPDAPENDAPGAPDGAVTGGSTVAAVTMSPPASGTVVALTDVVVVGNELRTSGAQVYVQDRGGGSYSGILIYCNTTTCKPALAALQPGDVIAVTGSFSLHASGGGNTLELVEPLTVTPSGTTAGPVAVDVPAALLAAAPDSAAFAPYNGVYVRVNTAVAVTSDHVVEFDSGSCTGDKKFANAFGVSVGEVSGYVYALFNDSLSLCVGGGCASCDRPAAVGQTFPFLRGVLQTQTFHPATGTAVAKVVLAPVEDIDAPAPSSVRALVATPPAAQAPVALKHVVVVGHDAVLGAKAANLFVQDPGGGRYSGVQVYCDKTQTGAGGCVDEILPLVPGDVVDITGSYDVYQKLTPEVVVPTAIVKAGQTVALVAAHPTTADVAAGAGSADGSTVSNHFAPYNQVLVNLVGPAPVEAVAVDDLYSTCGLGKDDWKGFSLLVDSQTVYVGDLFGETGMGLCSVDQCDNVGCAGDLAVKSTDTFAFVEGIARFSKNSKVQIAPRTLDDIPRVP